MAILRRLKLFMWLLFRDYEPPGTIPDPYRIRYRFGPRMAWGIAGLIHPRREFPE